MRQLTKEQLTQFINDTMVKVYEENAKNLEKEIGSALDTENLSTVIGECLAICMFEVTRECNQVLIETLDYILDLK